MLDSIDLLARGDRARFSVSNTSTQSSQSRVPALHRVSALNFVKQTRINHLYSIRRRTKCITLVFAEEAATGVMLPHETPLQRVPAEAGTTP